MSLSHCYLRGSLPTRWHDQPLGPTLLVDSVELPLTDLSPIAGQPFDSQAVAVAHPEPVRHMALVHWWATMQVLKGYRYPQVLDPWLGHTICAHLLRSLLLYFLQKCTICLSSSFRFTACTVHFIIKYSHGAQVRTQIWKSGFKHEMEGRIL